MGRGHISDTHVLRETFAAQENLKFGAIVLFFCLFVFDVVAVDILGNLLLSSIILF